MPGLFTRLWGAHPTGTQPGQVDLPFPGRRIRQDMHETRKGVAMSIKRPRGGRAARSFEMPSVLRNKASIGAWVVVAFAFWYSFGLVAVRDITAASAYGRLIRNSAHMCNVGFKQPNPRQQVPKGGTTR